MRNNLTTEELQALHTRDGAISVIMGSLKAINDQPRAAPANKMLKALGYDRTNIQEMRELAETFSDHLELNSLYRKAYQKLVLVDDIPNNPYGEEYSPEYEEEHKETVSEDNLFSLLSTYHMDKEDGNARARELREVIKTGVFMKHLMESTKKHLAEELKDMPRMKYIKTPQPKPKAGDKSLVLLVSDWHIGAVVYNEDTGGYDFKKLSTQVQEMVNEVETLMEDFNIQNLYVFHVGDIIEHISMRNVNQAFEAEFSAAEQISKASRLLIDMLAALSKSHHVTFGMVAGNHDRLNGNKNDKIYNDTVTYIILDHLIHMQEEFGVLPNVTYIDNRENTYEFTIRVAGKNIKVKHGDSEKKKDDVKIPKHIKEEPIDIFIMGHIHTGRIVQEDYSRFHVYVGSTMGANNFSKELNLPTTSASQTTMILTEGRNSVLFNQMMFDKSGKIN
ncbi:putative metallo-dependent phosphatase 2 [Bacillus phage SDFMU_Pbc]|uniref:Metallo-dependent phosphatase 2 n=1 Tax=Bacillus phage SDFMU_Pbc TaxID=3076135 RepID=A0AA96KRA0_9CAUD|nr:putative metallo-dependent phosphatase 2 [Bacillus phage SDFMU_Pbc]